MSVGGNGFLVFQSLQSFFFSLEFFSLLLILSNLLRCRVQDNFTVDGVEDDFIAVFRSFENACYTNDCRNFQRTGHDGTVACTAADFGCEALCEFLVQRTCVRRCQVLGNDDNRLVDSGQIRNDLAADVAHQTERNVLDVSSSFSHVRIVHGFENGDHHVGNLLRSIVSIDAFILDHVFDLAAEFRVTGHHQMSIEYCQFFSSEALGSNFLNFLNVFNGLCERISELGKFSLDYGILLDDFQNRLFKLVDLCDSNSL